MDIECHLPKQNVEQVFYMLFKAYFDLFMKISNASIEDNVVGFNLLETRLIRCICKMI